MITSPQPGHVVLDYQPGVTAGPITPTTRVAGVYVLVRRSEEIAPSTPATRPAEPRANERTRALFDRRREVLTARHAYTLEPIKGDNFGPWINIRNNLRKDRRIIGLYGYVQWDGPLPTGRTFGVRSKVTGGTPACKTDIAEAVHPRAELQKQWVIEGHAADPIGRPDKPGNGFLFPIAVEAGVAGELKLTGETCVYEQGLGPSRCC